MEEPQQDFNSIAELNSRLRLLESKYTLMRERVFVVNQNMIEEYKSTLAEIKSINADLKELKTDIFKMKETTANVVKEIEMLARKEQLKILEKYINFWNPMNFVTEKEVEEMIAEKHHRRKRHA
tara:strand:+ start:989 stop:1360 length:372 start_codon:yes stop_codon:yes gene_type:complete